MRRLAVRLRVRVRRFFGDRRAQLMPIVFYLGLAFFVGVILVVNTGRASLEAIRGQNAVDAAAVSSTNVIARGMNYVAKNNVTIAKLLASVAIIRAFAPAIQSARNQLMIAEVVANILIGSFFLSWLGEAMMVWINIEKAVLQGLDIASRALSYIWDANGYGAAWALSLGLTILGDVLVAWTPVLAAGAVNQFFSLNMGGTDRGHAVLVPVIPRLPACKGKFRDFKAKATEYAEKPKQAIASAFSWLWMSGFSNHYRGAVQNELNKMFSREAPIGDIHPYLIDGRDWPKRYSYTALGVRTVSPVELPRVFIHGLPDGDDAKALTYASGRLFNPTKADLWTPDWRAKLVRTRSAYLPTNVQDLMGTEPPGCEGPPMGSAVSAIGVLAGGGWTSGGGPDASLLGEVLVLRGFVDEVGTH